MCDTLFDNTVGRRSKHTHAVQFFGHCLRSGGSKSVLKINFSLLTLHKTKGPKRIGPCQRPWRFPWQAKVYPGLFVLHNVQKGYTWRIEESNTEHSVWREHEESTRDLILSNALDRSSDKATAAVPASKISCILCTPCWGSRNSLRTTCAGCNVEATILTRWEAIVPSTTRSKVLGMPRGRNLARMANQYCKIKGQVLQQAPAKTKHLL